MPRSLLLGVLAALWPAGAGADRLQTSLAQPVYEVSHTVDVTVAAGVATYKVRRTFCNPGTKSDQAILELDLPYGAAATGLRIRARDRWYDGELMERDKAEALYREMTGYGPWRPKDPALLSWAWADKLDLQVFPVMPGQVSTVEYTLTAPTRYAGGKYWLSYPRVDASAPAAGHALATPVITVHPAWGDAQTPIELDGKRIANAAPTMLLAPEHPAWMEYLGDEAELASYVTSTIEIPASSHTAKPIARATVSLDIAHTYAGDLRVDLVTPQGRRVVVRDLTGGGDNDIKGDVVVALPPGTTGAGVWRLVVSDHAALDTGSLDRWAIAFGDGADTTAAAAEDLPVFIPDAPENESDAGVAAISVAAPAIATWTARLGRVFASYEHSFARLELDVAPHVSELPRRAQVVFVVDRSRSMGAGGLAAQLAIIRAYLAHVPDAEVEVVAYSRTAERVFGELVPADHAADLLADRVIARSDSSDRAASPEAMRRLIAARLALRNGSELAAGASLAASVLAERKGPRRVVLFTDELTRTTLTHEQEVGSLAALPPDAVVHVVIPSVDGDDRVHLDRDDAAPLAALATGHHGIAARFAGFPVKTDKPLAPFALELVRPTRIEELAVKGFALETTTLREGEGLRLFRLAETAPARVVVTGKMWSDPVRREVVATDAFSRASAAFVFGEDKHEELSPAEQMRVAMYARAVSPRTSYVAAEPGTRPSTDGFDDANLFGGLLGNEAGEMTGAFGLDRRPPPPDLASLIDTAACVRANPPRGAWSVTLDVETTRDEIVDVRTDRPGPLATCLVEAAWAVRLDASVFHAPREQFRVVLRQ